VQSARPDPADADRDGYPVVVTHEPLADGRLKPSGRTAVMDAVLDAATELIADRGPNAVTVRAIAQRAGVNHALVHRYFGTKEDLIAAVIAREVSYFKGLAAQDMAPDQVFMRLLAGLSERQTYVRFLARAVLDGYRSGDLRPDFQLFGDVFGLVAASSPVGGADPVQLKIMVAALGSMALGWRIFGEFLSTGLGLDTMPQEQRDAAIDGFITSVLLASPAGRGSETGAP
jgi:AcrR family transcriptional regulator